jgi:hypothetical protein
MTYIDMDIPRAVYPPVIDERFENRPYTNWEGLPDNWSPRQELQHLYDVLATEDLDSAQHTIAEVGLAITALLLRKNERYGNSALDPIEVFAKGISPRDRMAVRMDDKLNRYKNGLGTEAGDKEHPGIDLAGYILLDIIAEWEEKRDR